MAVAALSTSAIALATVPTAATATAAGETPEAFAKLVSRAKPDGQAAQGETAPHPGDTEIETAEATAEAPLADAGDAAQTTTLADKPVDLVAELEALFAFAGQIGVNVPPTAAAHVATPTATIAAPVSTTTDTAPVIAARAATIATPFVAPVTPTVATPNVMPTPVDTGTAQAAMSDTDSVAATARQPLPSAIADMAALTPRTDTAKTTPDATANVTLRRDIAAIVASLKAAFHPAETSSEVPPALAAQTVVSPAVPAADAAVSNVVVPFVQPRSATATPAMAATAAPVATPAAVNPAVGEAVTAQAAVTAAAPEAPTHKTDRPVVARAESQITASIDPAMAADTPDIAAAPAPRTDAPVADSAEQPAAAAAPAVAASAAPAPPVIPAAVTPASWNAAPAGDATAAAPAPSHVDQTVTRHLDLARDTQWLDQLARDISQSVTRQNHMKFQLNPEHLGALTVEIANSAAGTAIKLSAETDQARAIIADAQPRLLAEVRAQGVRVAESHVDLNQQGNGGSAFAQGQQRQSSEDSKPFVRTQAVIRDDAGDSAPRDDGELYA